MDTLFSEDIGRPVTEMAWLDIWTPLIDATSDCGSLGLERACMLRKAVFQAGETQLINTILLHGQFDELVHTHAHLIA